MSNSEVQDRIARIGDNNPPLARTISAEENFSATVTAFLDEEYRAQPKAVAELLMEARDLPKEIEDDAMKGRFASLIKRLRDTAARLDAFHTKEKEPYRRGGEAVDQFFFGLIDKVARRNKNNNPGAADVLLKRLNDYDVRKLEEERVKRQRAADEAARLEREAREQRERLEREAEERRLAAERARKPEIAEQKQEAAAQSEAAADAAKIDHAVAEGQAQDARIATFAKPAEIMRQRVDDGTLTTMAQEAFAEVTDANLLDKEKLWPFIKLEAKEAAVRQWAKNTGHSQQMPGAEIGKRPKSRVR
jgi:hypothetical protein